MLYYSQNLNDDINAYEREQEKGEENALHCDICGEVIWEDYYDFNGEIWCENCVEKHRRRL